MSARLRFTLTNDPEKNSDGATGRGWFSHEEGKKASFILDSPSSEKSSITAPSPSHHSISKPAHALIECIGASGKGTIPYVFGGIEFVCNSRNVESYSIGADDDGKEKYINTHRGVRLDAGVLTLDSSIAGKEGSQSAIQKEEWYKVVIMNPGGPGSILRLRLKLLSLRPAKCSVATVRSAKLKARLPQIEVVHAEPVVAPSSSKSSSEAGGKIGGYAETTVASQNQNQKYVVSQSSTTVSSGKAKVAAAAEAAGLSQADIGAAISAVTMMVRTTEERVTKSVSDGLCNLDATVSSRIGDVERKISSMATVIREQDEKLNEQRNMIEAQNETMARQHRMIEKMEEGQRALIEMVQRLTHLDEAKYVLCKVPAVDRTERSRIELGIELQKYDKSACSIEMVGTEQDSHSGGNSERGSACTGDETEVQNILNAQVSAEIKSDKNDAETVANTTCKKYTEQTEKKMEDAIYNALTASFHLVEKEDSNVSNLGSVGQRDDGAARMPLETGAPEKRGATQIEAKDLVLSPTEKEKNMNCHDRDPHVTEPEDATTVNAANEGSSENVDLQSQLLIDEPAKDENTNSTTPGVAATMDGDSSYAAVMCEVTTAKCGNGMVTKDHIVPCTKDLDNQDVVQGKSGIPFESPSSDTSLAVNVDKTDKTAGSSESFTDGKAANPDDYNDKPGGGTGVAEDDLLGLLGNPPTKTKSVTCTCFFFSTTRLSVFNLIFTAPK